MAQTLIEHIYHLKGGEQEAVEYQNPFLERREPIIVYCSDGKTRLKIGDGKHYYNELEFINDINVNDVEGLTQILTQYEVDLQNLNDKIDKIVIDKVYDPNSDNAQSGKAVSQAIAEMIDSAPETLDTLNELANALGDDPNFATTVLNKISEKPGQATQNSCIIFNDYVNNLSGIRAFSMRQLAGQPSVTNPNYLSVPVMLNTVEGLSENDVVSGTLVIRNAEGLAADTYYWFKNFGYIASIDANNIITLNIAMQYASQLDIRNINIPKCNITVTKNPNLGDILLGELSTAFGENTRALGKCSITQGKDSLAYGEYSHAEGTNTCSSGTSAHSEGNGTQANGKHSHAEGFSTKATNLNTHAEGNGTQARGEDSHAEGFNTMAYGPRSHAEGDETITGVSTSSGDGYAAHAEGVRSKAAGFASHSEGQNTQALGAESHAEGYYTEAVGDYSHTEGFYTKASGGASHAEGENTEAIGQSSHAEGYDTKAIGKYSHAEGFNTEANHQYSHASGAVTKTGADCQTVIGKYNKVSNDSLFVVGNGTYNDDRKNAFEVKANGTAWLQHQGDDKNSIVIKSELDKYATKDSLVGRNTAQGGEIFNDYENNRAGSKAITFELGGYPDINEEYVSVPLIANATLEQGDMVSGKLVVTYGNTSNSPIKIESINQTNSEVTVIVTDIDVATAASKYLGVVVDCDFCNSTHSTKVVAVKLEMIDGVPKATLTVNNTDGFVLGDNVSISINNAAENFGIIAAISNGLPVLTIPTYVANQIDIEHLDIAKSFLRVVKKPDLGDLTIGEYSKASGSNTQALSNYAEASGKDTIASGEYSHAEGLGAFAGPFSHAEGFYTQANQMGTHSEGLQTIANGFASHTEGHQTVATGAYTHAEGSKTLAQEFCDHAEGVGTKTSGGASHAEGAETETDGYGAHAEGENSKALAQGAHAEGRFTQALAMASHAEGNGAYALGVGSHAENTGIAQGDNSHAEGGYEKVENKGDRKTAYHNKTYVYGAIGQNSHAEGQNSMAVGKNSHTEGQRTIALGNNAHAQGSYTYANGDNSFSAGEVTIADGKNQFVVGQYNDKDACKDALFVVGNGNKENNVRTNLNAFMVNKDGTAVLQTQGQEQNSVVIKSELDKKADIDYYTPEEIYIIQSNEEMGKDLDGIYEVKSANRDGNEESPVWKINFDTFFVVAVLNDFEVKAGDKAYVKASDPYEGGGPYRNTSFEILINLSHKVNKVDLEAAIKEEDTSIKEYIDTKNGNLQGFETVSEYVESTILSYVGAPTGMAEEAISMAYEAKSKVENVESNINGIYSMTNDAIMLVEDNKNRLDNINLTTSKALSNIEGSSNYVPYVRTTSPISGEYTITLVEGSLTDWYMITTDFGGFDIYNPTFEVSAGDKVYITYTYPESEPDGIWHFDTLTIIKDKYVTEKQLTPTEVTFMGGQTIRALNNMEFVGNELINNLTIEYPNNDFICSIYFTTASEGSVTITFPNTTKYIGGAPEFKNNETWELNIKNGVVVAGKVVEE